MDLHHWDDLGLRMCTDSSRVQRVLNVIGRASPGALLRLLLLGRFLGVPGSPSTLRDWVDGLGRGCGGSLITMQGKSLACSASTTFLNHLFDGGQLGGL